MKNKTKDIVLCSVIISVISILLMNLFVNSFDSFYKSSSNMVLKINYDHALSLNIEKMSEMSDYVVIGKYEKLEKIWNMRRDINDITKESATDYVEGRLYKFTVTEAVKGDIEEKEILVNHRYLERITCQIDSKEVTLDVQDTLYIEPQMGGTYMLFLSKDKNFGNFYGATEPFMVKIENDKVILESNLIEKEGDFVTKIRASNGENVEVRIGSTKIEDTISGKTLDEIKKLIK